jgi:hypothetical protein
MLRELLKSRSVRGKEWAAEFVRHVQSHGLAIEDINEELMVGWFANAIEVAKTATSARRQKLLDKANEMLKVQEQSYDYDQYMHGLYNGMEFVLCLVEDREAAFKSAPKVWGVDKPKEPIGWTPLEKMADCPGDCNLGIPCQCCGSNGQYIGRVRIPK